MRHYRVSARNAIGLGSASDTEMGVVEMKGRVVLSAAAASVAEGGSVAWTVTATTDEDAQPESGLAMEVTVVSEDGTAAAPGDYAALEAAAGTVTFRRSDFGRRNVQDVGYRWVAVKRGPVAVAIADDVEVEAEESFALVDVDRQRRHRLGARHGPRGGRDPGHGRMGYRGGGGAGRRSPRARPARSR